MKDHNKKALLRFYFDAMTYGFAKSQTKFVLESLDPKSEMAKALKGNDSCITEGGSFLEIQESDFFGFLIPLCDKAIANASSAEAEMDQAISGMRTKAGREIARSMAKNALQVTIKIAGNAALLKTSRDFRETLAKKNRIKIVEQQAG